MRHLVPLRSANVRLRNDLYCVGWGVRLYSLTLSVNDGAAVTSYCYRQRRLSVYSSLRA